MISPRLELSVMENGDISLHHKDPYHLPATIHMTMVWEEESLINSINSILMLMVVLNVHYLINEFNKIIFKFLWFWQQPTESLN